MWNLTQAILAQLESFHIRTAYGMVRVHKPHKGLFGVYPLMKDVLMKCGLYPVKDYIDTHRSTIAIYVVDWPIFMECKEGERWRGSMPRQWQWEQELSLDV